MEELKQEIEELKEKIEELEDDLACCNCSIDGLRDENKALDLENDLLREHEVDKESFASKCFDYAYQAKEEGQSKIKAFLNFKIQEKI